MKSRSHELRFAAAILIALAAVAPAQVKLPQYTRQVLPNGVILDFMQKPGVPLIGFRVMVKGGAEAEPAGFEGISSVTAGLLRRGTTRYTADQFSEQLDALGGSFQASSDVSTSTVTAEFLRKDFDLGLQLLTEAALHPTFPESEVTKLTARSIDGIKSLKDNPRGAIGVYYQAFFYGPNHPYGHPSDEMSLARIKRADIDAFHKKYFCGRNMVVIVTGDFDLAAAQTKVAAAFGSAPAGSAFEWKDASAPEAKTRLLLVDKPDATQTYFMIGQPGIDRRNPDRVKLLILNTLFGGRFTSMLNEALRVNSGLSYGASSSVQQRRLPGSILISTFTKTESTAQAVDMALDVLKTLTEKGITADQLASAKAYIKGTYPPQNLETPDQVSAALAELELYGFGRDELDTLFQRIDAVTLQQANDAARKYFKSSGLTFVLLGNAAKIRDAARKYSDNITELSVQTPGFRPAAK